MASSYAQLYSDVAPNIRPLAEGIDGDPEFYAEDLEEIVPDIREMLARRHESRFELREGEVVLQVYRPARELIEHLINDGLRIKLGRPMLKGENAFVWEGVPRDEMEPACRLFQNLDPRIRNELIEIIEAIAGIEYRVEELGGGEVRVEVTITNNPMPVAELINKISIRPQDREIVAARRLVSMATEAAELLAEARAVTEGSSVEDISRAYNAAEKAESLFIQLRHHFDGEGNDETRASSNRCLEEEAREEMERLRAFQGS